MAIIVCENISGVGDMKPPITKDRKIKIFRLERKKSDVIRFSLAKIIITMGNSNMNPKGSTNAMTKSKYCPIENRGCNSSVAKPMKNLMATGNTKA